MHTVLKNKEVVPEELGSVIKEVIHYHTLRGKFSSLHPELRREGIVKVEVGDEGLHFIRDSGAFFLFLYLTPEPRDPSNPLIASRGFICL